MSHKIALRYGEGLTVEVVEGVSAVPWFEVSIDGRPVVGATPGDDGPLILGHWPDGEEWVPLAPAVLDDPTQDERIDLEQVREILNLQYGIVATVECTGGNVATLFAGRTEHDGQTVRFAAAAGPGAIGRNGASSASLEEFYVGADAEDVPHHVDAAKAGCRDAEDVAKLIALQTRQPIGQTVERHLLANYGFDPRGFLL